MNAKSSQYATCRHIKTNGRVCQSPALTGGALCYFHRNLRHTHRRPANAESLYSSWQEYIIDREDNGEDLRTINRVYPRQDEIEFPALEDAESVQLATSMLFQAVATGQIHFKRARLMIATLKIACINQRALTLSRAADADPASVPSSIVRTTDRHILAAPAEDEIIATEIAGPETAEEKEPCEANASASPTQPPPQATLDSTEGVALTSTSPAHPDAIPPADAMSPPANSNEHTNLDLSHLDTRFCSRKRRTNV
jgi:hypothetical protein